MPVDLTVAIADGAEAMSDIAALADSVRCSGRSPRTRPRWRLLGTLEDRALAWVAAAGPALVRWHGLNAVEAAAAIEQLVREREPHQKRCRRDPRRGRVLVAKQ